MPQLQHEQIPQLVSPVAFTGTQKIYAVDPWIGPDCGSAMPIVAFIQHPAVIRRMLEYLHLWDLPPRSPPVPLLGRKMDERLPHRVLDVPAYAD